MTLVPPPLKHIIPQISRSGIPDSNDNRYTVSPQYDGATELEVAEALYELVRQRKPHVIVETGTSQGMGSLYFAKACEDNGFGHVWTAEFKPELLASAQQHWHTYGLAHRITGICGDVNLEETLDGIPDDIGLLFLDCQHSTCGVLQEYGHLASRLSHDAIIVAHDTIYCSELVAMELIAIIRGKLSTSLVEIPSCRGCAYLEV